MASRRRTLKQWEWAPYVFLSPFLLIFSIFAAFPLLFSAYLSFQAWDPTTGLDHMTWVGFDNYALTLTDSWFWRSLENTAWIALISGVPQHVIAAPLAFFIHTRFTRLRNGVVGAYFFPYITSSVAIALIFSTLFSKDFGVINTTLDALARVPVLGWLFPEHKVDWLRDPTMVKLAVSFVVFWRYVGWNAVLYLSAMQTIPRDLFDAARMDGATTRQQFRHVVLPLLRPMMFFAVTLTIIGNLQLFEEPFILTGDNGGAGQAAMTTAMLMYRTAFRFGDFGVASAISWLLFLLIAALTWSNNFILGGRPSEPEQGGVK